MRQSMEAAKTILLCLLIIASFVLTSILWGNTPEFQLIEPATYTKTKPVHTKQLEELVMPESIIFHFGEGRHTRAFSTDGGYRIITTEMAKWYFYDFSYYPLPRIKWEELTQTNIGLEIQYRDAVPVSLMNQLFTFRGEMSEQLKNIDRLWIYYDKEDDVVYALFMSQKDKQVIRARTVVSAKDLQNSYLPLGRTLPEQYLKVVAVEDREKEIPPQDRLKNFWEIYYLPKEEATMRQYLYNYLPITTEELIEAFFLDRTLVRQIMERDGTIIFTDGSRSVQMRRDLQTITFTDPAFQQGRSDLSEEEKVRGAISFINKHLGWTDDYRFEKIEAGDSQGEEVRFRHYVGAYPLINRDGEQIDAISVTMEEGQIVTMNRSLISLDKFIDYRDWKVMSGSELFKHLRANNIDTNRVKNAYLAYQTKLYQGYSELTPVWVVDLIDGTQWIVNARSLTTGGKANGLE